jgi:predicted O-linked N-acetylglucosamine transferase (SPINDLY family)
MRLAMSHFESGGSGDAEKLCRRILSQCPQHAEALHLLGILSAQAGDIDGGVELIRRCLIVRPDWSEAHCNLANALRGARRLDESIAAARRAVELSPLNAMAHYNAGVALHEKGMIDEAIAELRCALHLNPQYAQAMNDLGVCFVSQGKHEAAIALYLAAVRVAPEFSEAHNNLGVALLDCGRLDESIDSFIAALKIHPDYVEALNNLGNLLVERGQLDDAVRILSRAIRLNPELAEVHNNLGNALKSSGRLDEALSAYQQAVEFSPENSRFHSNLVYAELFHPDYGEREIRRGLIDWNTRHGNRLTSPVQGHLNVPLPDRRLRIGYISPDFRDHVIGRNVLPLLREHDHEQFEIFCYARLNRRDQATQCFERHCDNWRDITGLSDERVARMISDDRIDILIDLAMHLSDNVLPILARRPAPIQIAFAAYPGSTGLHAIDYRMSDPYLDSPGKAESNYAEKTIGLPETFWCYDPRAIPGPVDETLRVSPLPALTTGQITFGCLCEFCKINPKLLGLWAGALKRVAGSRLLMLAPPGESRQRILENFGTFGIGAERFMFVARQPRLDYLRTYDLIDICLDTLPYNGHTTSLDAMWMGVPVVTRVGDTVAGRAGWSQLNNLGLTELAARTDDQFINIAANLATDLPKLADLRADLRQRMELSPLMDARRFARNIENAYRGVWREWCARQDLAQRPERVEVYVAAARRQIAATPQ